jgi:hypothetical protein
LREFVDNFEKQTIGELFPTQEACVEFYSQEENFRRLLEGEIGENLMHRHNAIASFYIWPEICKAGMDALRELFLAKGVAADIPSFEVFWADFHRYTELEHAWGREMEAILSPSRAVLHYDVGRWLAEGAPKDPSPYRLETPEIFEFRVTTEASEKLGAALQVWTTDIKGLTKMVTRIQPTWQERMCVASGQKVMAAV